MNYRSIIDLKKNKTLIILLTLSVLGMTLSFFYYFIFGSDTESEFLLMISEQDIPASAI